MEILDKSHCEIKEHRNGVYKKFVTFGTLSNLYISIGAVNECDIISNSYIHFIADAGKLYFYCDNDMENGFHLSRTHKEKLSAYKVCSLPLFISLKKRFGVKQGDKFWITESDRNHNDKILYQIMLSYPIKKIKKIN